MELENQDSLYIKSILRLHPYREMDIAIVKKVMKWKKVCKVNNELGDWVGINPETKLQELVPNFSSNLDLANTCVYQLLDDHPDLSFKNYSEEDEHVCVFNYKINNKTKQLALVRGSDLNQILCQVSLDVLDFLEYLK
jgi:hypothetical protein